MNTPTQEEQRELQEIRDDPKVQRALLQNASRPDRVKTSGLKNEDRSFLGIMTIILVACTVIYFLLDSEYFTIRNRYIPVIQKIFLAIIFTTFILLLTRSIKRLLRRKVDNPITQYNLNRITDLVAAIFIFLALLSLLFANWYAAMVSFGIITLVLGLALQNPISSFFAWIYILVRKPYEVGDRIRIGSVKGDVIDLGYFDTTLWEFEGEYLSGDHPSGRIVRFSNARVFNEYVYNYSWPLFPFIWNEIKLFVGYESDLEFVSETVRTFVEKEVGEAMLRRINRYKKILAETPVDQLEVREYPSIILRANENAFVEVVVRYLVEPKLSGQVKNRIFKNLMDELRKYPNKVMLPKTNDR